MITKENSINSVLDLDNKDLFAKNISPILLISFFGLIICNSGQIDFLIIPIATIFGTGIFIIKSLMNIYFVLLAIILYSLPTRIINNIKKIAKYIFTFLAVLLAYHYGYLRYILGYIDMVEPLGNYINLDPSFSFLLLASLIVFSALYLVAIRYLNIFVEKIVAKQNFCFWNSWNNFSNCFI